MFETETEQMKEEKRSRTMLVLGGIGALALAAVIVFLAQGKRNVNANTPALPGGMQQRLEGALREGNPEFDNYKAKITLEDKEMTAAQNPLGMTRFTVHVSVVNRGDKAITGLELLAKAVDLERKVIAQNTNRPIPNSRRAPLNPGEKIRVNLILDTPAKISEGDISDILPEISGLKF